MKTIQLFFLILIIVSCSSNKKISVNTSKQSLKNQQLIIDTDINTENIIVEEISANTEIRLKKDSITTVNSYITAPVFDSILKPKHDSFNKLLSMFVSKEGFVHYKDLKKRQLDLQKYIFYLGENLPTQNWTKSDILAFWINTYNALTIDLILRHYPVKSIKDIKNPWQQRHWKLGDKWYNLDEIEHQILRKMDEPRLHFAIVCASISCPKLLNEAYTAENLEQQLTNATQDFLSDSTKNSISKDKVELSKIFNWFNADFTKNGSLIDFLNLYSPIEISKTASKSFKDYNWDLNE
ncbi:DUF547 domain-containing protein [Mariniflexile aquimaris]|uniref:DUF547 domain-containing protein n=1 Tax=Mariniflexile aquimaris TaxID=881009 RepID=A0ABW3BMR5_9FLAO